MFEEIEKMVGSIIPPEFYMAEKLDKNFAIFKMVDPKVKNPPMLLGLGLEDGKKRLVMFAHDRKTIIMVYEAFLDDLNSFNVKLDNEDAFFVVFYRAKKAYELAKNMNILPKSR